MRTNHRLPLSAALTTTTALAVIGWGMTRPAHAQDDASKPAAAPQDDAARPQPPPGGGRRMMGGGAPTLAASGDYVYVLRGNTLY